MIDKIKWLLANVEQPFEAKVRSSFLCFKWWSGDGWLRIYTNKSGGYDIYLTTHRGHNMTLQRPAMILFLDESGTRRGQTLYSSGAMKQAIWLHWARDSEADEVESLIRGLLSESFDYYTTRTVRVSKVRDLEMEGI